MTRYVLGIDPGYERSAFCGLADDQVALFGLVGNDRLLEDLRVGALDCELGGRIHTVAVIERIESYGMAVGREVFETVRWAGRFEEAMAGRGMRVETLPRRAVKLALCADSRAKDANVRQALIDRYGPGKDAAVGTKRAPGPLYGISRDVWSALAIAVAWPAV